MRGRASCRKCGQIVVEEIGKEIVCPGCGRVFRIPDDPRYYIRSSSGSIPPVTSTGRTRSRKVSTLGKGGRPKTTSGWRIGSLDGASPGAQKSWEVKPAIARKAPQRRRIVLERFPPTGEPTSFETGEEWVIAVELPHHSDKDIFWEIKDQNLYLRSLVEDCPYEYQIPVPTKVKPSPQVRLKHGVLEMRFKKT